MTGGDTTMHSRSSSIAVAALAICIAGCSVFDREAPERSQFRLTPVAGARLEGEPLGSLLVRRVGAVKPFDERGFVYELANGQWRIDPYNGFVADPSAMVTEAVASGLEDSGRFTLVLPSGVSSRSDYVAECTLESFHTDFRDRAKPMAVVRLRMYVLERSSGRGEVLRQLRGEAMAPLADGSPGAVAEALSLATAEAVRSLATQLPATRAELAPRPASE